MHAEARIEEAVVGRAGHGALQTARSGVIPNVIRDSLVSAPLTVPFNVDCVVSDSTGGSDHVVVRATATVSLTAPPAGI
jgi:hypothetical protein